MTTLADLPWLPEAPEDFRALARAAGEAADGARALVGLAGHRLNVNQLHHLAKALARRRAAGSSLAPLRPFRLALLSNATTQLLETALVGAGLRHGLAVEIVAAPFDQAMQAALDPGSNIHRSGCDAALLAFDHRGIGLQPAAAAGAQAAHALVEAALAKVTAIRDGLARHSGVPVLVQTVAPPPAPLFGSFDYRLAAGPGRLAEAFNQALADSLAGSPDLLVDVAALAQTLGLERWHDPAQWHLAKLPFAQAFVPIYAEHVARVLAAMAGKSRKCLVLDLDNTVWGGVIGDDGLDGIVLGQGDALGEAHLAVQQAALELRGRGIMLAVCSKNDDAVARRAFREHPDMLLREDHIAVFQANWIDKPTNLRAIAQALNIGVDALVFLDDNPVERALVRRELPEVAVPELPADPAYYARTLMAAGYFESIAFTDDDRARAEQYQANARRAQLEASATDLDSYLRSLAMEIHFAPFDPVGRARITQLINKSNQFNLTTRRYTESQVAALEGDGRMFTLQVRLRDVFGDNGMISVVIAGPADEDAWEIDTWLMSCRVLGRGVERKVLDEIVHHARERGIRALLGRYVPSGRNAMVADHYAKLGFAPLSGEGDETRWRLDVDAYRPSDVPMAVMR